jgi:hypothetical protein
MAAASNCSGRMLATTVGVAACMLPAHNSQSTSKGQRQRNAVVGKRREIIG